MEIVYKFNDGTVSKVEVDEEIGKFILASRKEEHANNEKTDLIVFHWMPSNMKDLNTRVRKPLRPS